MSAKFKMSMLSLRTRIFLSMIVLVLIASILMASISIIQFKNESKEYHQERLERKEMAINEHINYDNIEYFNYNKIHINKKNNVNNINDIFYRTNDNFNIKDEYVAKYLGIQLNTLRYRLQNKFSKTKIYFEKVDYIKVKTGITTAVTYMLNYSCFEKLAISGDSSQSKEIRNNFNKLREFLVENQSII